MLGCIQTLLRTKNTMGDPSIGRWNLLYEQEAVLLEICTWNYYYYYFYKYLCNVFSSLLMCRCSICYIFNGWDEYCQLWVCCPLSFQESNSHSKWGKIFNYLPFCVIVSWLVPKCGYYQVICAASINVLAISKWKKFLKLSFSNP